jgi:hypothetical protein
MAATIVQTAKGVSTLATTTPVFAAMPTPGNAVVLAYAADDYNGTPNTGWNQRSGMEQQTYHGGYVWDRLAAGVNSFPYTIGSATNSAWILLEISGLDASYYDISAGKFQQSSSNVLTGQAITPSAGERLILAINGASVNGDDFSGNLTGQTNGFTHVISSGPNAVGQSGTFDFISVAMLAVTANGSTAYSSDATYPDGCLSRSSMIISFKVASGGSAISGSASITEDADTTSATGTLDIAGSASIAEASDTSTGTGTLDVQGSASVSEADDTVAGGGELDLFGSAPVTEDDDAATGTGALEVSGTATVSEEGDAASGSGTLDLTGTSAIVEADDAASAAATLDISGAGGVHEDDDAVDSTSTVAIIGSADITEDDDVVAATSGGGVAGSANVAEDDDAVASAGVVAIAGSGGVQEVDDTATSGGSLAITGGADVAEDDDVVAGTAAGGLTGTAAVAEDDDAVTAAAAVAIAGQGTVAEDGDSVGADAALAITGNAAVDEADDLVSGSSVPVGGGAKAWINGEWVLLPLKVFASGAWVPPSVRLRGVSGWH